MVTYVAFLRGINVGGRVIKMADLKICLENAGLQNVKTLLQSGNVIFDSEETDTKKVRGQLEAAVSKRFNYPAKTLVYTEQALRPIVGDYPYDSSDADYQHYIVFMDEGKAAQFDAEFGAVSNEVEEMSSGDGVIYWKVKKGMTLRSERSKYFTKATYKDFNTSRNINTIKKILAL
jgi:uncharacterized protein (DUF1697 family)